jgi:hypothetical protein
MNVGKNCYQNVAIDKDEATTNLTGKFEEGFGIV